MGYLALVLAWAFPGLGHLLLGEKARGIIFAVTIHGLFAAGMLLGGIRAINPPDQAIWTYTQFLTGWPMLVANRVEHNVREVRPDRQDLKSLEAEYNRQRPPLEQEEARKEYAKAFFAMHPVMAYHPKVQDIGAVYCGIAGMLNLLVMFDVLLRITGSVREDPSQIKNRGSFVGQMILQGADKIKIPSRSPLPHSSSDEMNPPASVPGREGSQ